MNRQQWQKAYHLARLSTCINRKACIHEEAEVKAYRQLHESVQSGFITRKDFRAASDCVYAYRYLDDRLQQVKQRRRALKTKFICI
jgi:hypothetical protein